MNVTLLIGMLAGTVAAATPLLLAGLGELVAERSGVLNLGVEGMMLVGALTAVATTAATGSVVVALCAAVVAGAILGLAFAVLTVTIRADHVVSGLALVLFGQGLSSFLGHSLVGVNLQQVVPVLPIPLLSDIPFLGPVLFRQNAIVYLSYVAVWAVWFLLYRTAPGLALRAAGKNRARRMSRGGTCSASAIWRWCSVARWRGWRAPSCRWRICAPGARTSPPDAAGWRSRW